MSSTGDSDDLGRPTDGSGMPTERSAELSATFSAEQREVGVILERAERRTAVATDWTRLTALLASDTGCRTVYADWMKLNAELAWFFSPAQPLSADELLRFGQAETMVPDESIATSAVTGPATASPTTPPIAPPIRSPVLGFLGGVVDYVNHSRMLMFWLVSLGLTGWFAFQLGSLVLERAHRRNAPLANAPADGNPVDSARRRGGSFALSAPHDTEPVAHVTAIVDCHWRVGASGAPPAAARDAEDDDTDDLANADQFHSDAFSDDLYHVGSELAPGEQLDLARGMAEITFNSGAKVILNGPANFTVGSPLGGSLQIGKLTARVPHNAHGFTVVSSAGKAVDLGTEFGVAVGADHAMVVEVFAGEVAISSAGVGQAFSSSQRLAAGHAARVVVGKPVSLIAVDPMRFVRGLGPREDRRVEENAYLDWMRSLKPAVWFRMEGKDKDRVLHDEMHAASDGALHWDGPGNAFVDGRIGKCLWLRGAKLRDHAIVMHYPQAEKGKLTVAAWIYAASFPDNSSSPAICNWCDTNTRGQFFLGLKGDLYGKSASLVAEVTTRGWHVASLVEPKGHPFPFNEWQHVAFTTNGTTLRLYRQGREVTNMKAAGLQYPVRLPALGIGVRPNDWASAPSHAHPGYWDGKLDEIAIFNDALSADDIRKMANAPP